MKQATSISNLEIAVYALAVLGGAERRVHSEDIAARCYKIAPDRFGWQRQEYRKKGWPDKYVVRFALEDAKKIKHGLLVEGAYALDLSKDGWRMTAAGMRWFRQNQARLEDSLKLEHPNIARREADRFRKQVKQVRESSLFKRFAQTHKIDPKAVYQFTDLLNCSPDASLDVVAGKFRRLHAMAETTSDREVTVFLGACVVAFPQFRLGEKATAEAKREADS